MTIDFSLLMPQTRNKFFDNMNVNFIGPLKVSSLLRGVFGSSINSDLSDSFFKMLPRSVQDVYVRFTLSLDDAINS